MKTTNEMDFAENVTFPVQDEIQARHFSKTQATLHPIVLYYKRAGDLQHLSFAVISNHMLHNSTSVRVFLKSLWETLKKKFGLYNFLLIYLE